MKIRIAPLAVLALLPLLVAFSKKPTYTITFHAQGEATDSKKSMFPMKIEGRDMIFKMIPEISQQNVIAFHPFDAEAGGKGVALQLDFSGRASLEMVTRQRQGQVLVAMVNGQPVDYVVIDQVIENGIITIWRGVTEETIKQMDKKLARIKPGPTPSSSEHMEDMAPTTKKEKKTFWKRSRSEKKDEEKNKGKGKEPEPPKEVPSLSAPLPPQPRATDSIPLEGARAPGVPAVPAAPGASAAPSYPPLTRPAPVVEPPLPR
jgi:hypothetical protein